MTDLILLASPIFAAWLIFMGYLEPKYSPDETRFNHLFHGLKSLPDPMEEFAWDWNSLEGMKEKELVHG